MTVGPVIQSTHLIRKHARGLSKGGKSFKRLQEAPAISHMLSTQAGWVHIGRLWLLQ